MKKILTIFFLIMVCGAFEFGQTLVVQTQQEVSNFFYESDKAVKRIYYFSGS